MVLQMGQQNEKKTTSSGFSQSLEPIFLPDRPPPQANKGKNGKAAPLYITIGPPCAGKTNALKDCIQKDGYDPEKVFSSQEVALDEQTDVYHRIPLAAFIFPGTRLNATLGNTVLPSGDTIQQRLLQPQQRHLESTDMELRNIILRVAGRMTPQDFANRTRVEALLAGDTVKFFRERRIQVAEDLIQAVEQVSVQAVGEVLFQMQPSQQVQKIVQNSTDSGDEQDLPYDDDQQPEEPKIDLTAINATSAELLPARALIKTPYVDLFVPHAIFHGGLDRAEEQLQQLLRVNNKDAETTPVSWGNTNTRPVEYAVALQAAQKGGRPVQFVAWGTSNLPRVDRAELLRRTVQKFRNTGRYIPAGAVGAALDRVERLMQEAEKERVNLFEKKRKMDIVGDESPVEDNEKIRPTLENDPEEETMDALDMEAQQKENHQMNVALAALAGFVMDEDGFVMKIGEPRHLYSQKNVKGNKSKWKNSNKDAATREQLKSPRKFSQDR